MSDGSPPAGWLAAGLLTDVVDVPSASTGELVDLLRQRLSPSTLWTRLGAGRPPAPPWPAGDGRLARWRRPDASLDADTSARVAEAWSRLVAEVPVPVEAVRVEVGTLADARDLRGPIAPAGGLPVSPVVWVPGRRLAWHWPVRLRVLGPASWADGLRQDPYHGEHFTVAAEGPADLLLVAAATGLPPDPDGLIGSASAVVAVGDAAAEELFASVAGRVPAPMVAAVPGDDVSWWHAALPGLCHDLPLDVVLRVLRPDAVVGGVGAAFDVTAIGHWATALARHQGGLTPVEALVAVESFDAESAGARRLGEMVRTGAPGASVDAVFEMPATAGAPPPDPLRDTGEIPVVTPSQPASAPPPDPLRDTGEIPVVTPSQPAAPPPPSAPPVVRGWPGPEPREGPVVDERRAHARIEHAGAPRNSFVRGAENLIRCWIGLPDSSAAMADRAIPPLAIPAEGLHLAVELRWAGEPAVASILLPADRGARSNDAVLRLAVPPELTSVEADLVFTYRGRCVEWVHLEAAAVSTQEADRGSPPTLTVQLARREVIQLPDAEECTARLTYAGGSLGVYDGTGGRTFRLDSPAEAMRRLATELFTTDKQLVRQQAVQPGQEPVLDVGDEQVRLLLRDLARFGAGLHQQLAAQGLSDVGERIQLLTLDAEVIVPLEFVYDRGYPAEQATLCDGWRGGALAPDATECPACPAPDPALRFTPVICPMGFWAFRKVIERWDPDMAAGASAPTPERRELRPLDSALFACSGRVTQAEQDATWTAIQSLVGTSTFARDWDQWYRAVQTHPRLLVALPHHGEGEFEDYLQIGDDTLTVELGRLARGMIGPAYVNPDGREPGPLLLLLGCTTAAVTGLGYLQLVRTFERYRTAIVLGTLSQVLGRNAAPLARELVTRLVSADLPATDFGTVLRTVRRTMMARGHMLALGVVAVGDAEWRLAPAGTAPGEEP